jgi:hypothetical protein
MASGGSRVGVVRAWSVYRDRACRVARGCRVREHREALLPLLYAAAITERSQSGVSCDCLAHRYGNAADRPMRRAVYPTDLTDAQWAVIAPLIPIPLWLAGRGGRPEGYCHREIVDAMLYLDDFSELTPQRTDPIVAVRCYESTSLSTTARAASMSAASASGSRSAGMCSIMSSK